MAKPKASETYYPPLGYYFKVQFSVGGGEKHDTEFQEVTGFSIDMETESWKEGGENRFEHKLPTRSKFSEITLKRGYMPESGLGDWVKKNLLEFEFEPASVDIFLLNEEGKPLSAWYVYNAYPTSWSTSDLKAEESAIVVETMKLTYQYWTKVKV